MKCTRHPAKGFTLVELMIVVVVLGILAAVAVPAYFNHILRSRQTDAYHNLLDIKSAEEMHYSLYNVYAGTHNPLAVSNTFTSLLSFDFADNEYFRYAVAGTGNFVGMAIGEFSKLKNNEICIGDDYDPCIVPNTGELKQTLDLDECDVPTPAVWDAPFDNCP